MKTIHKIGRGMVLSWMVSMFVGCLAQSVEPQDVESEVQEQAVTDPWVVAGSSQIARSGVERSRGLARPETGQIVATPAITNACFPVPHWCPTQWTCNNVDYYTTKAACITACGTEPCYLDANCSSAYQPCCCP
jgi:hypothetical protein